MNQILHLDNDQRDLIDKSHISTNILKPQRERIKRQLRKLGADRYDLMLPETNVLPLVLHPDEQIEGIVFGRYKQYTFDEPLIGRGALVATDQRVLLVDHKPLFMKCDEISYAAVSAITYSRVGFASAVVLHSKTGRISVRTFNQKCAYHFMEAIESKGLTNKDSSRDNFS